MTQQQQTPPRKILLTAQGQLQGAKQMVFCAVFFIAFGLLCWHTGSPSEALFWAVLLLGSLIALMDTLRKRQKILRGEEIYRTVTPDSPHAIRAVGTMLVILLTLADIVITPIIIVSRLRLGPQPYDFALYAALVFVPAVVILLYGRGSRKRMFLWNRPRPDHEWSPDDRDFDVPPLTWNGVRSAVFSLLEMGFLFCWIGDYHDAISHGQLHWVKFGLVLAAGLLLGSILTLIYIGIVAVLTRLNKRSASLRNHISVDADGDIWPPPPGSTADEKVL